MVLLGAPGAGKGTQAKLLSERFNVPQISTGDILRANVSEETALGKKAREYMDRGALVPDEIVVGMVAWRIEKPDCAAGFILDGFPRNIAQAEATEEMLAKTGRTIGLVIGIEVDREELVKRLGGRRVCRECAAAYHTTFNPPAKEGICDACGEELYQRDDDTEKTISERLDVYGKETFPLAGYYKKKGTFRAVDGRGEVDRITDSIVSAIERGSDNT